MSIIRLVVVVDVEDESKLNAKDIAEEIQANLEYEYWQEITSICVSQSFEHVLTETE